MGDYSLSSQGSDECKCLRHFFLTSGMVFAYGIVLVCLFFGFFETDSLCSSGCPGIALLDQADLELSSARIKGVCCHPQREMIKKMGQMNSAGRVHCTSLIPALEGRGSRTMN